MRRLATVVVLAAITIPLWVQTGFAQDADDLKALRKEMDTLKEGQSAIQKELQDIKQLLQARPTAARPPQDAVVSVDGAPIKGDKNAKVTLVEFTDYQ